MTSRKIVSLGLAALLAVAVGGSANPTLAGTAYFEVMFDTSFADSGLMPGAGGLVDVQINEAAAPMGPATVTASVSVAMTDGTLGPVDPPESNGTVMGTLPGGVSLDNTQLNEQAQTFMVQSFFDVFVEISGSEVGAASLNPSGTTLAITVYDSGAGFEQATLSVQPDGSILLGTSSSPAMNPPITITPLGGPSVPEPAGIVLMGMGLSCAAVIGRRRRRRTAA